MNRSHRPLVLLLLIVSLVCVPPARSAGDHAFVGSNNCKKCHLKEWKSWSETKMAKSFELLKPGVAAEAKTKHGLDPNKDYTTDATCLACHTTGLGKPGGFVDLATSPDRAGVGCEMCHGAGGDYTAKNLMSLENKEYKRVEVEAAGLISKPTIAQCQNCHNTNSPFVGKDYVFDFEARKAQGTHEKFPLKYVHE